MVNNEIVLVPLYSLFCSKVRILIWFVGILIVFVRRLIGFVCILTEFVGIQNGWDYDCRDFKTKQFEYSKWTMKNPPTSFF